MEQTKKLYWIEDQWFSMDNKNIWSDFLTYSDAADGRTEDYEDMRTTYMGYVKEHMESMRWQDPKNREDEYIPVWIVYGAMFTDEVDEGDTFCVWSADEERGTRETKLVMIFASEKRSKELGIYDALSEDEKKAEIMYFDPEKIFNE